MAKQKQKSGLGRGLNALFDSADINSSAKDEHKVVQETPVKKEPSVTPITSTPSPAPRKQTTSDIYISEDAIENAKVVERVAHSTSLKKQDKDDFLSSQALNQQTSTLPSKEKPSVTQTPVEAERGTVSEVPLDMVVPNKNQPRINFKPEEVDELAASIEREGLLQPILVRKKEGKFEIIAGERRYRACLQLGMKTIPVRYWDVDEGHALELALIENIQRSDLNPIEEAYGYRRLMESRNMTQSQVAQTVSKGRSTIANALRLLELPEEAQKLLFEEKITSGHARAILSIPTTEGRKVLTDKIIEGGLTVRQAESLARLLAGRSEAKSDNANKRVPTPQSFKKTAKDLSKYLGAQVRVKTVKGKNKIEIQFKDEDELKRIYETISHKESQ